MVHYCLMLSTCHCLHLCNKERVDITTIYAIRRVDISRGHQGDSWAESLGWLGGSFSSEIESAGSVFSRSVPIVIPG